MSDSVDGINQEVQSNDVEISNLHSEVNYLLYGIGAWLGTVTIASVIIFVVVNIRLSQAARALEDAEIGSESTSTAPSRISNQSKIRKIFHRPKKVIQPKFYESDQDTTIGPMSSQQGPTEIKVPGTDDECECENGNIPRRLTSENSASVHSMHTLPTTIE